MMKLFGKMYAGMLTVIALIILIAAPICGYYFGKTGAIKEYITLPASLSDTVVGIICAAVLLVLTFFLEALCFGHEAQIIELRRKITKIEKKMN